MGKGYGPRVARRRRGTRPQSNRPEYSRMAKWLAALLLLLIAAGGAFYVMEYRPVQDALAAAQVQATEQERQVKELRGRVGDLETIRDQLQRTSSELQQR